MKKTIVSIISLTVSLMIFFSGCLDLGGTEDDQKNAIIMTAKEHYEDIPRDSDYDDGYSLLFDSLEDGDILVIKDTISDIYYVGNIDETKVTFGWIANEENKFLDFFFEGDITAIYSPVDEVEITVTIKYVNFTYEEFNFEMEIYEEQWESEEYFKADADSGGNGLKPLPQNSIKKA